jgi:hypothetical protein
MAVRLLQLISGTQPYFGSPAAWRSLKENLAEAEITISEFPDGSAVKILFTPQTWPNEPSFDLDRIGTVERNGEPTSLESLRNEFEVIRIGGDETISAQFQLITAADASLVEQRNAQLEREIGTLETDIDSLKRISVRPCRRSSRKS